MNRLMLALVLATTSALRAENPPASAPVPPVKPDTYPLDTCVVEDSKLDSMGKPFVFMYKGREVRFCCKGCKKGFLKNPEMYLKKIDDAAKAKAAPAPAPAPTPAPAPAPAQ